MEDTGKTLCSFCAGEIPATALSCMHCGRRTRPKRLVISKAHPNADFYEIVPDGEHFVIAIRGEVKVRGLDLEDLENAQSTIAILNRFIEDEKLDEV